MKLSDVGEFGLIARLAEVFPAPSEGVVGIGDDAAVIPDPRGGPSVLLTTDMLVEGVHFEIDAVSPRDLGYTVLAANVSDIAAMGGRPLHAAVSLGAPGSTSLDVALGIAEGISEAAAECCVEVVGGDTVAAPCLVISVALTGEADRPIFRRGARPGDAVVVTGALGRREAVRRSGGFVRPVPRLAAAAAIASELDVGAMIDISDGLAGDCGHLARAGGVRIAIEAKRLPIDDATRELCGKLGVDPVELALTGGEDYELAFTVAGGDVGKLASLSRRCGTSLTVVGSVSGGEGVAVVGADGVSRELAGGYTHFGPGS